ncbi:MAG: hypothetical protein RIT27_2236 [Pseudomonadota bacterium]|jgi:ribosome biogenesis GTPase A
MTDSSLQIVRRLESLEKHLAEEHPDNPTLAKAVQSFRRLDQVAYNLGLLTPHQSYATRVSWWPMVAVLGTFSAGKSTFINSYLGRPLQRTGTQAVDDKFTVICYTNQKEAKTLPGVALDADPRFPFFQISRSIAEISQSGPQRIDAYLQLKTCPNESVRGKILIDSPGFDADSQRASTLRLTQHIIDLADLVLVFFDARHPEPGAMHDTLEHLVAKTIDRADSNKFLYILNQMDVTAKEDNPEEVVAAWQRALAQAGLTSGRFYRIYNPEAAVPIDNPVVKARYETKCQEDLKEISTRMNQVEVERSYRIVGAIEQTAKDIEDRIVPKLKNMIDSWKKRVWTYEAFGLAGVLGLLLITTAATGTLSTLGSFAQKLFAFDASSWIMWAVIAVVAGYVHFSLRKLSTRVEMRNLSREFADDADMCEQFGRAFVKSTAPARPMLFSNPAGWSVHTKRILDSVRTEANDYIQVLNDRFTNPSGR